jgi:tRNA pseudouridine38-40 synthase
MPDTPARLLARRMLLTLKGAKRGPPPVGEATRRFRAVVAYDGTGYAGWQRQRRQVSVQEILEAALECATGLPVTVLAAGRTDTGVHADGQVVSFDSATRLPADALRHLCGQMLPDDVVVRLVEEAPAGFNPQRDAVRKLYRYCVFETATPLPRRRHVAWQLPGTLELPPMRAAGALLVGTHDFRAFRNDPGPTRRDATSVRTIERIDVARSGEFVLVDVVGPGFLYMMVRNVAAVLVAVGLGERPPAWAGEMLASRDRRRLPPPAPPHGLCLVRVEYGDGFGGGPLPVPKTFRRRPPRVG